MRKFSSSENILLIEQYLQESFELRYNVLSKKIEVRERKEGAEFRPLTEKMANSIVRRIKLDLEDVTSVNQNVQEFLNSEDICHRLLKRSHATTIHVGMKLKTQGYKNVKHHGASCYQVIPLVAA